MTIRSLARWAFYILLAAAPLGTRYIFAVGELAGRPTEAGTVSLFGTQILALLVVGLAFIGSRNKKIFTKYTWWPVPLIAFSVISAALSGDGRSAIVVAWLLLGYLLFLAVKLLQPSLRKTLWAIVIGGAAQALLAIWQYAIQQVNPNKWLGVAEHLSQTPGTFVVETLSGRWLRAYGTLAHPNMLGAYLVLAILAGVALVIATKNRHQLVAGALLAVNSCGLALAMSRSATLGLVIGLAVLVSTVFIYGRIDAKRWRTTMLAVAIVAVSLLSSFIMLRDPITTRLTAQGRLENISVEARVSQLADARLLLSAGQLFGVGPGHSIHALAARATDRSPWSYEYIHNQPMLVLVEIGPLGLIAWLALFAAAFLYIIRRRHSTQPEWLALIAAPPALLIIMLFDHFMWTSWFGQLIFWVNIALIFGLNKTNKAQAVIHNPQS